ncbi:MAG TPA: aminopeptidase P family protein [Candidatus Saccharimonadales bacterium]|nr:aminopeptidase P family protein [Candidatus Saccharimonadales bacterium]
MNNSRIEKVRNFLTTKKLDAMIVSSVSNIFYLSGISHFSKDEREAYLLITMQNTYFFTTSLYMEEVKRKVEGFILQQIGRDQSFEDVLEKICQKEKLEAIGFEEQDIRYAEYAWIAEVTENLSPVSLNIRVQKDSDEIEKIQKACDMGDKAFTHALSQIKRGISEKDIQIQIELFLKQHNADISFRPIVAFGANSSMPHYESSADRKLENNECVLIDMGAKVAGYCSDMTRTVFFGEPTKEQKDMYQTVLESQQKAIELLSSSWQRSKSRINNVNDSIQTKMTASNVDKIARDYIISKGYPPIPHSLGHGIGIDVHEPPSISPNSDIVLRPGMVFSIEPGIYIPDFMGVRIEDLVVIERESLRILTLSSKEIIVL